MNTKTQTRLGCLFSILFIVLLIVLFSLFLEKTDRSMQKADKEGIAWGSAAEKCKEKYKSLPSSGKIKVPNCKKRTETDSEYVFYWSKPLGIIIKKEPDILTINRGTCRVSKQTGEITYMTLNDRVILGNDDI